MNSLEKKTRKATLRKNLSIASRPKREFGGENPEGRALPPFFQVCTTRGFGRRNAYSLREGPHTEVEKKMQKKKHSHGTLDFRPNPVKGTGKRGGTHKQHQRFNPMPAGLLLKGR